jgi:hypothetical protein
MGKSRRNQRKAKYHKVPHAVVAEGDGSRAPKPDQKATRRSAAPKAKAPSQKPQNLPPRQSQKRRPKVNPEANAPNTFAGAALSRLGGMSRRVYGLAQSGVQALRWAGHMIEVARGRKREA